MALFGDPVHEEFGMMALGFTPYGGADYGEIQVLAGQIVAGDDDSFFAAFHAFAERRIEQGDRAAAAGHEATAADCYLRAACLLGLSYHPIYGTPVDDRLRDAFHLQMDTFARALAPLAAEPLEVPYEGTTMPAWFVRAPGFENQARPVILVGGGWDSTMVENYLGMGVAALARGYHVLLHDGPGQGRLLIDEGLTLRHDWEHVVTPVVDAALAIDVVDPSGVVYWPWSLGGYMAPRAAAFEHRLAAAIADPGQLDVGGKFATMASAMGLDAAAVARLPEISPQDEATMMKAINADRGMHWRIVQRGFWTNGAADLGAFLAEMDHWKLAPDVVAEIHCPVLVAAADADYASSNARDLYDALPGSKHFTEFTSADGAGDHCEIFNRSLANRTMLDWLDDTLGAPTT